MCQKILSCSFRGALKRNCANSVTSGKLDFWPLHSPLFMMKNFMTIFQSFFTLLLEVAPMFGIRPKINLVLFFQELVSKWQNYILVCKESWHEVSSFEILPMFRRSYLGFGKIFFQIFWIYIIAKIMRIIYI